MDHIEHDLLRKMGDPRIHFAVVCASHGCPPLGAVPYRAAHLEAMLEANVRNVLDDPIRCRIEPSSGRLELSPIFKWYAKDFGGEDGVRTFGAGRLRGASWAAFVKDKRNALRCTDFDWSLNESPAGGH